ncbi:MAG: protease inhibitor I42 family protein [Methanothrix sp.]
MLDYKRLFISHFIPLIATLLIMLLLPLPGLGDSRVCPEGCDYSGLEQALNASSPDDTITVCSGVYSDPVVVAKKVNLHGLDTGQGKPVIFPPEGRVILAASGAALSGFRFPRTEDKDGKPADNCVLEVILPARIFFNDFSGKGSVCPEDEASWNSSQMINYQFGSRVMRGYLGNYWADYSGSDEDGDGIGDEPMLLNEKNIDYHPLIYPMDNYRIPQEKETETGLLRARVGEPFTISLPSNPTTGYDWTADYDNVLLRAEDARFESSAMDSIRLGVGGTSVFVFTPLRTGKTTIRFVYKRSWENIVADTRAFYVDIAG